MATVLNTIYNRLQNHPQYLESIVGIFYLPSDCVDMTHLDRKTVGVNGVYYEVKDFNTPIKRDVMNVSKYSGYPLEQETKFYTYPYSYIEVTAYNGETLNLQLEHIEGDQLQFESWGYLSPDARVAFLAKNYNKDTSLDNALIVKDFPQLPTASSAYDAYIARSKTSTALSYGMGAAAIVGGVGAGLTGVGALAGFGGVAYGVSTIANTLAQQNDIKHQPNSVNTQIGGSGFNIANGVKGFTVKKKMIKPEYRNIIRDYWKSYGHKTNRIKTPNLKTRQHFNYVKTVNANITGNIPQEDITKLKDMFNNGVTLWHGDYVGDYSKSNEEV